MASGRSLDDYEQKLKDASLGMADTSRSQQAFNDHLTFVYRRQDKMRLPYRNPRRARALLSTANLLSLPAEVRPDIPYDTQRIARLPIHIQ